MGEGRRKRVRCEMDQINTTKDHHYQQLARKEDVLQYMVVTLDTTQLLRSALNLEADQNAIVFLRNKKKKGQM